MNIKKQAGMSMWGVMSLVVILAANGLAALKIVPMYMDNKTIQSVVESMSEPLQKKRLSKRKIRQTILQKLRINNIRDLAKESIKIAENDSKVTITVEYEARRNLFYNLDAIAVFKNSVEVIRGGQL